MPEDPSHTINMPAADTSLSSTPKLVLYAVVGSVCVMSLSYFLFLGIMSVKTGDSGEAFKEFARAGTSVLAYLFGILTSTKMLNAVTGSTTNTNNQTTQQ